MTPDGEATGTPEPETDERAAGPSEEEIAALDIRDDMLAYWLVLNSRKPFVSANEGCQEFMWDEYFWCTSDPDPMYTISYFSIVDLDNDGTEELVMVGFPETTQVLDYQEGTVYSYQFAFRGMAGITINGVYSSSSAFDIGGFHRICFDKGTYEEETLAYMEHDYFEVGGKEVSSEDFFAYTEPFAKAERIENMDFTKEMLDEVLLGDLGQEEIIIVESIEPEEICDENNPLMADVPENYLTVLTGTESFMCVKDGRQECTINGNCIRNQEGEEIYQILYFSMVDMDGDGEEEVVVTCARETLILHAMKDGMYGYAFEFDEVGAITEDGEFKVGYPYENNYARIVSFEEDGCRVEPVEDYEEDGHERIRYYYYSEEAIARWLGQG